MQTRRTSLCEQINNLFGQAWNYIQDHLMYPISHNKSSTIQAVGFFTALGYIGVTTAQTVFDETENLPYTVARISGAMLKNVLVPLVTLPSLMAIISRIQRSGFNPFLGLNNRIMAHKIFALGVIEATIVHAIGHYFNNKENYIKQPGITGLLMAGALAVPLAGTYLLHYCKPNLLCGFSLAVKRPHQIGTAIFIVSYGFHTTDLRLLPTAGAIAGLLALNLFYDMYSYLYRVRITTLEPIFQTDSILLGVSVPAFFNTKNYLPGQYAELSIPAIDGCCEYPHPFTIVNVNENEINFIIKKSLKWTSKLVELSLRGSLSIPVTLWGPYGSPLNSFYKKTDMTIITAGSGITPFLAFIFWLVAKKLKYPNIYLHVSSQKIEELAIFFEAFAHPNIHRIDLIKSVDFYITRQNASTIQQFMQDINVEGKGAKRYKNLDFQLINQNFEKEHVVEMKEKEYSTSFRVDYSFDDMPPLLESREEKKIERISTPSSVAFQYPTIKNLSFFPFKSTREKLKINLHAKTRMKIAEIVESSPSHNIFACASTAMIDEVQVAARKYHKKFYKESF